MCTDAVQGIALEQWYHADTSKMFRHYETWLISKIKYSNLVEALV